MNLSDKKVIGNDFSYQQLQRIEQLAVLFCYFTPKMEIMKEKTFPDTMFSFYWAFNIKTGCLSRPRCLLFPYE